MVDRFVLPRALLSFLALGLLGAEWLLRKRYQLV